MERESFEDPQIAALMNERFVCVKVDREERPDVDAIYMEAVQAMTGHGGWPLNVFLTPDQAAVLRRHVLPAGAAARACRRGARCCEAVADAWREQRAEIDARAGGRSRRAGRRGGARAPARRRSRPALLDERRDRAAARASTAGNGGWGGAPKFPRASAIEFLLARGERAMRAADAARDGAAAGSTTRSAAASRATRSTRPGSCRTSRRCSTTTRCSRARTCTPGR